MGMPEQVAGPVGATPALWSERNDAGSPEDLLVIDETIQRDRLDAAWPGICRRSIGD
jgi:hypothetical protein